MQYATGRLLRPVFTMAVCHATHAEHSSEGIHGEEKHKSAKLTKSVTLAAWNNSSALLVDFRNV